MTIKIETERLQSKEELKLESGLLEGSHEKVALKDDYENRILKIRKWKNEN